MESFRFFWLLGKRSSRGEQRRGASGRRLRWFVGEEEAEKKTGTDEELKASHSRG